MIPPNVLAGAWQARSNANEQSTKKGPPKAGTRGLLVGLVLGFTNSSLHRPRKFLDYPPEAEDMDDIVAFPGDSRTARQPSLLLVLSIRFGSSRLP